MTPTILAPLYCGVCMTSRWWRRLVENVHIYNVLMEAFGVQVYGVRSVLDVRLHTKNVHVCECHFFFSVFLLSSLESVSIYMLCALLLLVRSLSLFRAFARHVLTTTVHIHTHTHERKRSNGVVVAVVASSRCHCHHLYADIGHAYGCSGGFW